MAGIRLDKLLSDAAKLSRADARERIKAGRITVNGVVEAGPEKRIDENAALCMDGKPLGAGGFRYIMMNKPAGVISATGDPAEKTVFDLIPQAASRKGMFPVGRLDKDTTGLLILTDDGDYCHRVTHPKRHISKLYEVNTEREAVPADIEAFAAGLTLGDGTCCLPAKLSIDSNDPRHCFVEIFEGKYHQVKRMLAATGNSVVRLRRVSIGMLKLDENLGEGCIRVMSSGEAALVFNTLVTK